ncbi:MAG TPA: uracil-DNA glycosylase [Candidatus Bathyarchaeia archaeon]|nr:uracil-DNA glycosylase [Candidatus Bathyarchaeia archaeon]
MDPKIFKQQLLDQLYAPYKKCIECPLGGLGRKNVVFGEGNPDASLMFIGEAPGQEEDEQGRPFVGRSGRLLTQTLTSLGINRPDVFITNIVKCRPPNNRKPFPEEMAACKKLLLIHQIKIIRPRVICTLGAAAVEGLFERMVKITHIRGTILEYLESHVVPAYHPAYVLRNPAVFDIFKKDIQKAYFLSLKNQ